MRTKRQMNSGAIAERNTMRIQRDEAIRLAIDSVEFADSIHSKIPEEVREKDDHKAKLASLKALDTKRREIQSHLV